MTMDNMKEEPVHMSEKTINLLSDWLLNVQMNDKNGFAGGLCRVALSYLFDSWDGIRDDLAGGLEDDIIVLCHVCKTIIEITSTLGGFGFQGGALFKCSPEGKLAKCSVCYKANPIILHDSHITR